MMRCLIVVTLLMISLTLSGCGDPTINGDSETKFKDSTKKVREALPLEQRAEFDEAIRDILFVDIKGLGDLATMNADSMVSDIRTRLDGMTGVQVIEEGKRVRAEKEARRKAEQAAAEAEAKARAEAREAERRAEEEAEKAKEKEQALMKINELRTRLAAAEEARAQLLVGFTVDRARFGKARGRSFSYGPTIVLGVKNDIGKTVTRVYFDAELSTPGRDVAWVRGEFNYEIQGGLQNGESARWNLSPNMFGKWSDAPIDRSDTLFTALPVAVEGTGETMLADARFDADDEKRLLSLVDGFAPEQKANVSAVLESRRKGIEAAHATMRATQLQTEISELESKLKTAAEAKAKMETFKVTRSRFYRSDGVLGKEPVIDLAVENLTGKEVSVVGFKAVLTSPGRDTPWLEDSFNYQIRGGLKAGASDAWKLAPNRFSDWGKLEDRTDYTLTLTVTELEGPDGKPLFDAVEVDPDDTKRLESLRKLASPTK